MTTKQHAIDVGSRLYNKIGQESWVTSIGASCDTHDGPWHIIVYVAAKKYVQHVPVLFEGVLVKSVVSGRIRPL